MSEIKDFAKNWRILLLLSLIVISFMFIALNGLHFGIDFSGGTQFQIHLGEKISDPKEMSKITGVLFQRMDAYGLKDTKVTSWGNEFVVAQIAETDPKKVEEIESVIKTQGLFEVTLDGNLIFTGNDIIDISRDPARGYGFRDIQGMIEWHLPFVLRDAASLNFTKAAFHKCAVVSYDPSTGYAYECEKTYFFLDRPHDAVIVMSQNLFLSDRQALLAGNSLKNIPQGSKIEELLKNADVSHVVVKDGNISEAQLAELSQFATQKRFAIVSSSLAESVKQELREIGFEITELPETGAVPWIWEATGAQQVISLSEDIANMGTANLEDAEKFSNLVIRGFAQDADTAQVELKGLATLLESGSLSVPVESVSKETISPLLGESFLFNAALIGFLALLVVAIVLYIRYRYLQLIIPMVFTALSEVLLILGFAAMIHWNIDLAAVAGILAAVGTGVDDQIIITDELSRKGKSAATGSLITRISRAFFIIMAAAATTVATMAPIIFLGFGLGKLVGFAITTIAGVTIGVFITRPAFGEIAKRVIKD